MTKKPTEYLDRDHEVMSLYYDLCEMYDGSNAENIKKQLEELIKKDPDFLESYLFLGEILQDEGNSLEAATLLENAFKRALNLITDKEGNWPDILNGHGWKIDMSYGLFLEKQFHYGRTMKLMNH